MIITEETGSTASHSTGSLIIKHKNEGGSSSIVFPASKGNSDYGYIQFNEGNGTGDVSNPLERSASLIIGCENDVGSVGDCVIIRPNSSNTGCVGINTPSTSRPTCALDINGTCQASNFKIRDSVTTPLTNRDTFTVDTNGAITATSLSFLGEYKLDGVRLQFGPSGNTSYISCNDWDTSLMTVGGIIRFNHNNIPYVNQNQNYYIKQIINNYQITITATPPPNSATGTAITFVLLNIALGYVTVQYNGDNMTGSKIALPSCAIGEQNATSTKLQTLQVNNTSSITGSVFTIQNHTNTTSGSTYGPLTTTKVLDITNTGAMTLNGTYGLSYTTLPTFTNSHIGYSISQIFTQSATAISTINNIGTYSVSTVGTNPSITGQPTVAAIANVTTKLGVGVWMCNANLFFNTPENINWIVCLSINTALGMESTRSQQITSNGLYGTTNRYASTSAVLSISTANTPVLALLSAHNGVVINASSLKISITCTRIA